MMLSAYVRLARPLPRTGPPEELVLRSMQKGCHLGATVEPDQQRDEARNALTAPELL